MPTLDAGVQLPKRISCPLMERPANSLGLTPLSGPDCRGDTRSSAGASCWPSVWERWWPGASAVSVSPRLSGTWSRSSPGLRTPRHRSACHGYLQRPRPCGCPVGGPPCRARLGTSDHRGSHRPGSVRLGLSSGIRGRLPGRLQTSRVSWRDEQCGPSMLAQRSSLAREIALPIISGSARCTAIRAVAR